MLYVVKRDGREVKFNTDKIGNAIKKASDEVGEQLRESEVLVCIQRVIQYIEESKKEKVSVVGFSVPENTKILIGEVTVVDESY